MGESVATNWASRDAATSGRRAPLAGSPAGAATQVNGTWYCFGKKATKTVPDLPGHWETRSDGTKEFFGPAFYSTGHQDVIVGTESVDDIWVSAGDTVCSRGGNDTIYATADVNPRTGWNRIKVDAGYGNDDMEIDYDTHDWGNPAAKWITFEAHGGPGDDTIWGGEGNDVLFGDSGANLVYCGGGTDAMYGNASMPQADCEKLPTYPGYKPFSKFVPAPTTATTSRATSTTVNPTPVTTSPPAQPPVTTTTR